MIAWQGGLKPDSDLRALGLSSKNRVLIPGVGHRSVIRGAGMTMDELGEHMVEHGFLDAPTDSAPGDSGLHNRIREMIDAELRGKPVRPIHEQAEAETAPRAANEEDRDENLRADVRSMLTETGERPEAIKEFEDAGLINRAAFLMHAEGLSADNAWERAVMAQALDDEALTPAQMDDIYGEGTADAVRTTATPASREGREPEIADARQGVPQPDQNAEVQAASTPARERDKLRSAETAEADRQEGARAEGLTFGRDDQVVEDGDTKVVRLKDGSQATLQISDYGAGKTGGKRIVATVQGEQIGGVAFRSNDDGTWTAGSLLVNKEHRRKGLATALYDFAEQSGLKLAPETASGGLSADAQEFWRSRTSTERTPAGEQTVLPGAEKASDADLAQKKADEPLKPKKAQQPADEGLFGDSAAQTDLVDMAHAPEKHSAALTDHEQASISALPKLDPNMVRLYRGEYGGERTQVPEWLEQARTEAGISEAEGRWFTDKPEIAKWYVRDAGPEGALRYLDVPVHAVGRWRVSENVKAREFSADPENEYFLPNVFRGKADPVPGFTEPAPEIVPANNKLPTEPRPEGGVSDSEGALADRFADHFRGGEGFSNILQARKLAKDAGFSEDTKKVEEAIELGVVKRAREIVAEGDGPAATFKALVDLYAHQPRLGTRTSTSVRDQAYSTPVPLAYVASRLARASEGWVAEPTAGNGALLIEVDPKQQSATINEVNGPRAKNLTDQGFRPTGADASEKGAFAEEHHKVDVVLANPPFGVVTENGASKGFDLSDFQKGYRTNEIDHAIALRALDMMRDGGRAVLILGGPAKTAVSEEARSNAYNGKSKREFFKVLYDRYNVTDHFGVAGELYERQGAGWPVDVIVIDGAGKSARKLPAADVPRLYTSWDELGALLDERRADAIGVGGEADQSPEPVAGGRPGRGNGAGALDAGERGDLGGRPGSVEPRDVQPGSVHGNAEPVVESAGGGRAGLQPGERGKPARAGSEPVDFDAAFDAALDATFGGDTTPKATNGAKRQRPTKQVLKDTVASGAQSADAAMAGLVELFGGGKTHGSGPAFDEATYAKAKPLFISAAEKFREFAGNVAELIKRMVGEMQRAYGLTRDALERMRPHLRRFMDEVHQGAIKLTPEEAPRAKPEVRVSAKQEQATESQVTYVPKSESPGLGTLVPVNMRTSIERSLSDVEKRVGNLDTFVAKELGYDKADLGRYFGAEQVDALALAIDNFARGKGFIIGDQTGIGKGRVNAGIIRWAIANDKIPIFVTEKPNLYGDMYRDLTDIGIQDYLGREPKMLMTNSGETVPLDDEGKVKLRSGDAEAHRKLLDGLDGGKFRDSYDIVFTTYNQMQTVPEGHRKALLPAPDRTGCRGDLRREPQRGRPEAYAARQEGRGRQARSGWARRLCAQPHQERERPRVLFLRHLRQAPGRDGPLFRHRHGDGGCGSVRAGRGDREGRRADAAGRGLDARRGRPVHPPRTVLCGSDLRHASRSRRQGAIRRDFPLARRHPGFQQDREGGHQGHQQRPQGRGGRRRDERLDGRGRRIERQLHRRHAQPHQPDASRIEG
jgi:GNAT superfamily N-acetyltransferase